METSNTIVVGMARTATKCRGALCMLPSSQSLVDHKTVVGNILNPTKSVVSFLALRGGALLATTTPSLDLDRVTLRLEGLDTYAVISAIILSAIIDVYLGCETKKRKFCYRWERAAQYMHAFCTTTSAICALYVIVLFSFFTMYAKTAVGTNADDVYMTLLADTSVYRYLGFQAFIVCLATFECSFVANIFLHFEGHRRWLFSGLATIGTLLCLKEWSLVCRSASAVIFKQP